MIRSKFLLGLMLGLTACSSAPSLKNQHTTPTIEFAEALPAPLTEDELIDPRELRCLQENIYFEARNQGARGMKAVADVTLNRVGHKQWGKSVCSVVHQKKTRKNGRKVCQFSWVCEGKKVVKDKKEWEQSKRIAKKALLGELDDIVGESKYYHTKSVHPVWRKSLTQVTVIGDHIFYMQILKFIGLK